MIGIVFIGDLYVCPYLHRYSDACERENIPYEVLFWNRCNEKLQVPENYRHFDMQSDEEQSRIMKGFDFVKYRKWVKKQIKNRKYDKLILLSTLSGIILADVLKQNRGKYVFDIRDYSYEWFRPFFWIEKKIVKNSAYTAISSPGFINFLPDEQYSIIHNMQSSEAEHKDTFEKKKLGDCLNVVWNGTMRYFNHQKNVILRLANDHRFRLLFHGYGPELEQYQNFVKEHNINNVFFTGKYNNSQKSYLLAEADILNNSYWIENHNEVLYALSNRYYDGLIYKIPQLVEAKTYKTDLCEKNGIGIGIDACAVDFADCLYSWYFQIDVSSFEASCELLLGNALHDDVKNQQQLKLFLTKK